MWSSKSLPERKSSGIRNSSSLIRLRYQVYGSLPVLILFRYFVKISFFCHTIIYIPSSTSVSIINSIFLSLQYSTAFFHLFIGNPSTNLIEILLGFSFWFSGGLHCAFGLTSITHFLYPLVFLPSHRSLGNIYVFYHLMVNGREQKTLQNPTLLFFRYGHNIP